MKTHAFMQECSMSLVVKQKSNYSFATFQASCEGVTYVWSGSTTNLLTITYKMLKGCEGKHHTPTGYADLRLLKSIRPQPARAPLMGHNKSAMAWEWQKRFIFLCLANSITCTSRQIETDSRQIETDRAVTPSPTLSTTVSSNRSIVSDH